MPKSCNLRQNLSGLAELMAPPALVLSLPDLAILSSNAAMIAKHGLKFSESGCVVFKGFEPGRECQAGLDLESVEPVPSFRLRHTPGSQFQLMLLSKDTAMIVEAPPVVSDSACPLMTHVYERSSGRLPPFHFSYLESLAGGRRLFPHPELLKRLGLHCGGREGDWRGLVATDDLPHFDNAIANVRAHGGSHEISYKVRTRSGSLVRVSDYFSLAPAQDGKWPMIVGTVVSGKPLDDDLQSLKSLEIQGRLLGGMVHDFKNLLGGIQNIIEWSITLAGDKPELADALKKTLAYTSQATKLISGTLRMGTARKERRTERISIPAAVRELQDLIRHSVPSTIAIELELDPQTPRIFAQKDALKDIVLNLCVNARDAMRKSGSRLTLSSFPKNIKDAAGRDQLFAGLAVSDDGCGMTPAQLNSIFEAFYSTKETGAGLGLWMVHKTVKSLDGRISVDSEPGKGSRFELLFPSAPGAAEETLQAEEPPESQESAPALPHDFRSGPKRRILYVEDDPLIRSSVSAWLESLGFELLESGDGIEALDIFKEKASSIDLVIQDFIIPGRRGDELLDELLKVRPDIPVVIASANHDEEQVEALRKRGARAFLPKPFLMDELLRLLNGIFHP